MGILLNKSKNYIINGAMDYWQRGASFAAIASGIYAVDRFRYEKIGTMVHTVSQDTDVPTFAQSGFTFPSSYRLALTTAQASLTTNQRCRFQTRIEGQVFAPLRGKPMTLSFWVKATLAGVYSVTFGDSNGSVTYVKDYTINASDTWEKKTISLTHSEAIGTWNYTTAIGLSLTFCLASGPDEKSSTQDQWLSGDFKSSASSVNGVQAGATNFRIAGIQLEEGVSASNFERAGGNSINELQLCQRYYEKNYDLDAAPGTVTNFGNHRCRSVSTNHIEPIQFKVVKRVIPSFSVYNYSTGALGTWRDNNLSTNVSGSAINPGTSGSNISFTTTNTNDIAGFWTADAEL